MKQKQKRTKSNHGKSRRRMSRLQRFNKLLIILIVGSALAYIGVINDLSIQGFKVEALKQKRAELKKENEAIGLKVTELESYRNIANRAQELKMVKVGNIDYITVTDSMVAKR